MSNTTPKQFAKIFIVEGYQVLVRKNFTGNGFELKQTVGCNNVYPTMTAGCMDADHLDQSFESYSQQDAEDFFNMIKDYFK